MSPTGSPRKMTCGGFFVPTYAHSSYEVDYMTSMRV